MSRHWTSFLRPWMGFPQKFWSVCDKQVIACVPRDSGNFVKTLKIRVKLIFNCPRPHAITYTNSQLFRNLFKPIISDHQLKIRIFKSISHVNFITKNFYLTQFPMVMDIYRHIYRGSTRPRLIQKRRNLLTLLNGDAFYPLSTWPQDIQQLFWKKPIGHLSWCCFSWVMAVQSTW